MTQNTALTLNTSGIAQAGNDAFKTMPRDYMSKRSHVDIEQLYFDAGSRPSIMFNGQFYKDSEESRTAENTAEQIKITYDAILEPTKEQQNEYACQLKQNHYASFKAFVKRALFSNCADADALYEVLCFTYVQNLLNIGTENLILSVLENGFYLNQKNLTHNCLLTYNAENGIKLENTIFNPTYARMINGAPDFNDQITIEGMVYAVFQLDPQNKDAKFELLSLSASNEALLDICKYKGIKFSEAFVKSLKSETTSLVDFIKKEKVAKKIEENFKHATIANTNDSSSLCRVFNDLPEMYPAFEGFIKTYLDASLNTAIKGDVYDKYEIEGDLPIWFSAIVALSFDLLVDTDGNTQKTIYQALNDIHDTSNQNKKFARFKDDNQLKAGLVNAIIMEIKSAAAIRHANRSLNLPEDAQESLRYINKKLEDIFRQSITDIKEQFSADYLENLHQALISALLDNKIKTPALKIIVQDYLYQKQMALFNKNIVNATHLEPKVKLLAATAHDQLAETVKELPKQEKSLALINLLIDTNRLLTTPDIKQNDVTIYAQKVKKFSLSPLGKKAVISAFLCFAGVMLAAVCGIAIALSCGAALPFSLAGFAIGATLLNGGVAGVAGAFSFASLVGGSALLFKASQPNRIVRSTLLSLDNALTKEVAKAPQLPPR